MDKRISLLFLALFFVACATNPVTGRREFMIVSEAQEQQLGDQAHPQVIEQFGVYDEKPELNQMVSEIGRRIAAVSDRPDLPWRFTLLDTPMINAMAIPGGYVYVTRGILERMNSEDELAGVIAHEIAHVAGRHSAQRMSQSQLAQLGMLVGAIIGGPAVQSYGDLIQLGAGLLFTRYSRQQETQADLLGTAYVAEAGFNPQGAEQMLLALQRLEKGEISSLERYFIDHPDPAKRVRDVRTQITSLRGANPNIGAREVERGSFVQRLRGMITGNSTLQTTIRDGVVYQRRYGIILPAPTGWEARAGTGDLFQMSPPKSQNTGFIAQEVPLRQLRGANAQMAIRNQLQQMGLRYVTSGETRTQTGERFMVDVWVGQTSQGAVAVESTQFVEGDKAVVFLMLSPRLSRGQSPIASLLSRLSFDRGRARTVEPPRMEIGTVRSADSSWNDIAARATGSTRFAEEVAEINGFDVRNPPPAGLTVKLPREVVPDQ